MSQLREFQIDLLKMLKEVDIILKKNDIPYFLVGGSVLGAIRHKGFIPWDDDIDIGFYPKDFYKMEEILQKELSKNLAYYKIGENPFPNAPIGYLYDVSDSNKDLRNVATIDFFVINNVPDNKLFRKVQQIFSLIYHFCIYRNPARNRGKKAYYLTKIALFIIPNFLLNILEEASKTIISYWDDMETKDLANLFGVKKYYKEIMPQSYIGKSVLVDFEGHKFPIPEQWDLYLKHLYGDYMKLPPEEDRKPHHKDIEIGGTRE